LAVSASVGATQVARGIRMAHALAAAELACKRAKALGRNRVEWSPLDAEAITLSRQRRTFASRSLQDAINTNQFRLDAQPLVGLRARRGETLGYELLVRMRSPMGEDLAPDKFFDAAERYELMPALDRWVLCSALDTLKAASAAPPGLPYAFMINVSAQTLATGTFPQFALEQIEQAGLPAGAFCFEIAEAAAVGQLPAAERFIRALADAGCKLALDDFGCGLSSLAHLKHLPVHYLKIDGRFVRHLCDDRIAESIVSGIARAARTLGVGVIAEHVETEVVATRLQELDVDWGQGFHLGRPQPLVGLAGSFARVAAAEGRRNVGS
jgi:Amt family ammonium transporter